VGRAYKDRSRLELHCHKPGYTSSHQKLNNKMKKSIAELSEGV
jgi:hypothetical protein